MERMGWIGQIGLADVAFPQSRAGTRTRRVVLLYSEREFEKRLRVFKIQSCNKRLYIYFLPKLMILWNILNLKYWEQHRIFKSLFHYHRNIQSMLTLETEGLQITTLWCSILYWGARGITTFRYENWD